jgi:hypothetical protein
MIWETWGEMAERWRENWEKLPPNEQGRISLKLNNKIYPDARSADFFRNINKESSYSYNGTPCWEWTGNLTKDYWNPDVPGCGFYGGMVAYRFLWTHILGRKQPKGMELHHRCGFRPCVNPWQLELLARKEHRATP